MGDYDERPMGEGQMKNPNDDPINPLEVEADRLANASVRAPWQYITNEKELEILIRQDRLAPCLVRYRGVTEGRFTAPAQDVPDLLGMLEATGRYVRDISTGGQGR